MFDFIEINCIYYSVYAGNLLTKFNMLLCIYDCQRRNFEHVKCHCMGVIELREEMARGLNIFDSDIYGCPSIVVAVIILYGLFQIIVYLNYMIHRLVFVFKFVTSSLNSTVMLSD